MVFRHYRRVAFFGDSFVAAGKRPGMTFPWMTAAMLGGTPIVMGRGGTGFARNAPDGRLAYPTRLADLNNTRADLIVVQASGNDGHEPLTDVMSAARAFLAGVTVRPLIVLGPMWAGPEARPHIPAISDGLAGICGELGIPYVVATDWMKPALTVGDGVHPNRRGHWMIARKLAAAIRREHLHLVDVRVRHDH